MKHIERALLAIGMTGLLVVPAYAYLDPSVMTYAIQIIAGIVVAVGAALLCSGVAVFARKKR